MNTVKHFTTIHLLAKLDRCVLKFLNTLNDISDKVCDPNKTGDLSLRVFNLVTARNESKTTTKHIMRM